MKKTLGPPPLQALNGAGGDKDAESPTPPMSLPEFVARREAAVDDVRPHGARFWFTLPLA